MKLGGVVVQDRRGLEPELPLSPSLRLPVPSIGKRPRGNHRGEGGLMDGFRGLPRGKPVERR